jgi:hypothetical protein
MDLVKTELVSRVESQLHRKFASKRVHGEWFEFASDEDLNSAIAAARKLAEEASVASQLFIEALKLGKLDSTTEKRHQNEADVEIATRYQLASRALTEVEELRELVFQQFASAKEAGVDVSGKFSEKTVSLKPIFKTDEFLKEHPDLFRKFATPVESKKWGNTFRVSFKLPEGTTLENRYPDLSIELAALRSKISSANGANAPFELAEADSELLRLEGFWNWEKEIAKAELQIATGRFAGIEKVSSWNRKWTKVTKDVLDESALLKAHPKIYADFIEERAPQKRRSVSKSKVG